jgi:hypothetical protein
MCLPYLFFRNAQGVSEAEIVLPPFRNIAIIKLLKRPSPPGGCMNAVGDGINAGAF